ncbi:Transcriptional regulatory protein DegU [bacterium HR12]|nr:Transcriptional regulatory protein DegU [bacterium HR12]
MERGLVRTATRVRVLVVDDNAGFRDSLVSLLATGDFDVVGEAGSGPEALDLVERVRPDVVLMDVRMPGMDGIETTRRLKAGHPELGVVALSGHEDQDVVRDMLVAGANGYVLKDSDGDQILSAVLEAAGGRALLSPVITPRVIEELAEALERERRRARELEQAQAALVERSTRRQQLVARLSHELRTPVTVILGMAQTLAKTPDGPERTELLERIIARARDLARLVERFELALDAGLTEHVDLVRLASDLAAQSPRVRVEAEGDIPPVPLGPGAARRILEELLDNALRFSPEGSPVEVRLGVGDRRVEVRVRDHGPGVAPQDRERIFGPLEQVEDVNVRVHQGAGMGLALARTAARTMGGDVTLEVSGPEGSTFLWTIDLSHPRRSTPARVR